LLVLSAIGLGWGLLILSAYFTQLGWEQCEHLGGGSLDAADYFVPTVVNDSLRFGWLSEVAYFSLWLVAYLIADRSWGRHHVLTPPNKSLERTSEG
jgi:hypothetical protein